MGRERACCRDVLIFGAMVAMECTNVGLNTLYKAAANKGMSYYVFTSYNAAVAALILLPSTVLFFLKRSNSGLEQVPPLNFSVICKICLLAFIGCTALLLGFIGMAYSSPTLGSAISTLVPAFTFILAIIFRMEKLEFKTWTCRAKVLGTIVSIAGAFVVTLYKGPKILSPPSPSHSGSLHNSPFVLASQSGWALGGLFLAIDYFLVPWWYIVQTQIMKEYPAEAVVVCLYNVCVCIIAAVVGVFREPELNKWRIRPDIALASMICYGIFGSGLSNIIHSWGLRLKGPVFVAMFRPLSIAIAAAMGVVLLGDTLYLGSVLGATVIVLGFYTVMWGKAKEEMEEEEECNEYSALESTATDEKSPLLKNHRI